MVNYFLNYIFSMSKMEESCSNYLASNKVLEYNQRRVIWSTPCLMGEFH